MTTNKKFQRAANTRRFIAIVVTIVFHVGLYALVTNGSEIDYQKLVPEKVKEWIGTEKEASNDEPRP